MNLQNVGADSLSSLSSRSGRNSARGHHSTQQLVPNPLIQKNAEATSGASGDLGQAATKTAIDDGYVKVDYFKTIKSLNQANMSIRANEEVNETLKNVSEMVDPSKEGAVFEIKNQVPEVGFKTVDYVPKQPVMEYLNSIEGKHKNKIDQYKNYALNLKERYQKYETESSRHYSNVIKRHQRSTDDLIAKKEEMLHELST